MRTRSHGFTLVELSIVLVILGLLVGGVLTGQALIKAAELRSVPAQYNGYIAAVHSFRDKYFALPGDMATATSFWGKSAASCNSDTGSAATPGTCNGDGNGVFAGNVANGTAEMYRFWQQLTLAGLLEGSYTGNAGPGSGTDAVIGTNVPRGKLRNSGWSIYTFPTIAINSGGWANFEGNYGNTFMFGAMNTPSITEAVAVIPEDAWNIDTKLDDGKPGTGIVRVYEAFTNCHDATPSTTVAIAGTANYRLNYTSAACSMLFNF